MFAISQQNSMNITKKETNLPIPDFNFLYDTTIKKSELETVNKLIVSYKVHKSISPSGFFARYLSSMLNITVVRGDSEDLS